MLLHRFRREGNAEVAVFLAKMDKQVDKLTSLISDLLDVTRVTAGRLSFREEAFNFNDLVTETVGEMQQTSRRHTIETALSPKVLVFADRNRIWQVITNLLSNAIKYSPKSRRIIVSTAMENNNIKLFVQDFGIGIPEKEQPHVFDQFFRLSGLLQDTYAGLGLGLFISAEIIKRSNGTLNLSSEIGNGSTFYFTLPVYHPQLKLYANNGSTKT